MEFTSDSVLKLAGLICGCVSRQISYARDLRRKVAALSRKANELRHRRDDIQAQVRNAVSVGRTVVLEVKNWLEEVDEDDILGDVASIESDFRQGGSCFNGCCPDLRWRLKMGKKIKKKMEAVELLLQKGVFNNVAESPRRPQMPEFPVPSELEQQSTSQKMLQEIEQALSDEEIGIVCVSGMGGVGKTTLMKEICNRLAGTRDFHVVIWVTVSKDLNLNVIQQKIGNKLKVQFGENEGMEERRDRLYARLKNVKYMLILDDLWKAFSLYLVGIPPPDAENGCRIAITTRLLDVTSQMEIHNEIRAKTIRMKTLRSDEAWDLFCSKTGDAVLLPKIKPVAEEVVKECGGLPLAIQTVGAAMRGKEEESLWENALRSLKGSAPEVRGMERQVFLPLKLSYDSLEDSSTKFCFLLCALFPEDYRMDTKMLVRYWAFEEAWIDKFDRLEEALNKGHDILDRLKDACLLESVGEKYVKMHDLLRDLAIWITSQSSQPSSKFLVKSGLGLRHPPQEKYWEGVGRISLMSNHIQNLQIIPNSPDLVSLFLCSSGLHAIHSGFFQLMPQLRILDLSRTGIRSLPPSLSHLVNLWVLILTSCIYLVEIPPLGELKELQHLDFSRTGVRELPEGIANLVKLKQLHMLGTRALDRIPCNFISALTCLEHLGLEGANEMGVATWREVTALPRLVSLEMTVRNLNGFTAHDIGLLGSFSNLKRFRIQLGDYGGENYWYGYKNVLFIDGCRNFPGQTEWGLISHVEYLSLTRCNPACLSQLLGYTKLLRKMHIYFCEGVKCIIDWTQMEDCNALDCLEELDLGNLADLENIFDGGPPPPSTRLQRLHKISISRCPKLRCVLSSSMVGHLHHQLKYLSVRYCGVECIIDWGKKEDNNALDCLEELDLCNLPDLENIFNGGPPLPSTRLQRLHKVSISGCPKLRRIFSSGVVGHLPQLKYLRVQDCGVECSIDWRKTEDSNALDCLEELDLRNFPDLENIFDGGPPLQSTRFQRLRIASIYGCPKLGCVVSSSMVGHLHQLKCLRLHDCEGVECIIDWRKTEDSNALDCLEELDLRNLPDLENIFDGGPPSPSTRLQRLHKVSISRCPKLRCVFSSSMVGHLHQLQCLAVACCEGVEEIAQGDMLPDDALQRLSFIRLSNLPKLSSICSVVLKSLKEIRVHVCPELKTLPPLCSAIQRIGGGLWGPKEWWERMEWGDDDHSKSIYWKMFAHKWNAAMIAQRISLMQTEFLRRDDGAAHPTQPLYSSPLPGRGEDESVSAVQPRFLLSLFPGTGEGEWVYVEQPHSLSLFPGRAADELVHDVSSRPLSILPGRGEDELIHDISSRPFSILLGTREDE